MENFEKNMEQLSKLKIELSDDFDIKLIELSKNQYNSKEIKMPVFVSLIIFLIGFSIYTFSLSLNNVTKSVYDSNRNDYIKSIESNYSINNYLI